MVELQVSLSEQTLDDLGCASLGSAHGIDGEISNKEAVDMIHTTSVSHDVPCPVRVPLGQHGVVLSSPSMLGQVEVLLQQAAASGAGRGLLSVGGPRVSGSVGSQSEGEEGGVHCEGVPGSYTAAFEIPSEEATPAEEHDSDSEGDQDKRNKHRAKHASKYLCAISICTREHHPGVPSWFECEIMTYSLRGMCMLIGQQEIAFVSHMRAFQSLISSVCAPQNSVCLSLQWEEGTHSF